MTPALLTRKLQPIESYASSGLLRFGAVFVCTGFIRLLPSSRRSAVWSRALPVNRWVFQGSVLSLNQWHT